MPAEGALIDLSPVVAYEGAHFSASPSVPERNLDGEQSSKVLLTCVCKMYAY